MATQELRIAKLSRILNNSSLTTDLSNPAVQAAYSRAYNELQKTIQNEKAFHAETDARQQMQFSIERQEELLKENMRKHHFNVLKKQIEDRRKQRDINEVEKLLERPKSLPKTPPEQPKFFIREGLKEQIKDKRKKIKESQKNELEFDQFVIKAAKNSLDEDLKKKKQVKNQVFEGLKQSWKEEQVLRGLKKQADRLMDFANSNLNQTVASPKSKGKMNRNRTTESSPVKEASGKIPQTEKKAEKNERKGIKVNNLTEPEEGELLEKLARLEKQSKKVQDKKLLLKQLQNIEEKEKTIKNEKQLLIEYFASKKKSQLT